MGLPALCAPTAPRHIFGVLRAYTHVQAKLRLSGSTRLYMHLLRVAGDEARSRCEISTAPMPAAPATEATAVAALPAASTRCVGRWTTRATFAVAPLAALSALSLAALSVCERFRDSPLGCADLGAVCESATVVNARRLALSGVGSATGRLAFALAGASFTQSVLGPLDPLASWRDRWRARARSPLGAVVCCGR